MVKDSMFLQEPIFLPLCSETAWIGFYSVRTGHLLRTKMRSFVQVNGIKMELITVLESLAETDSCISWLSCAISGFPN